MRISAAVMAHPVREEFVPALLTSLDRDVPVHWDMAGPPTSRGEQRWKNGVGAWRLAAEQGGDWLCVIQDDALVCGDFLAGFEKAIENIPDENAQVVSAYIGSKRPSQIVFTGMARQARTAEASWARALQLAWGVAIAVRADTAEAMLAYCDQLYNQPYDLRISKYYRHEADVDCWYTWPCLADHRDTPSLIAHGDTGRHARSFHDGSALDLTWDGPVIEDKRLKRRQILRQRQELRGRAYNDSLRTKTDKTPTEMARMR